jgi:chromosome segregation ATPase
LFVCLFFKAEQHNNLVQEMGGMKLDLQTALGEKQQLSERCSLLAADKLAVEHKLEEQAQQYGDSGKKAEQRHARLEAELGEAASKIGLLEKNLNEHNTTLHLKEEEITDLFSELALQKKSTSRMEERARALEQELGAARDASSKAEQDAAQYKMLADNHNGEVERQQSERERSESKCNLVGLFSLWNSLLNS